MRVKWKGEMRGKRKTGGQRTRKTKMVGGRKADGKKGRREGGSKWKAKRRKRRDFKSM